MSEETTTTPADMGSDAASNPGGLERDPKTAAAMAASAILRDKEGDLRPRGRRKKKVSYLTTNKIYTVDYKETALLKRFLNDRGKMLPTRQSGNTAKQQRMIAQAIRRAREMALIPFVVNEPGPDRPMRPREDRRGPRENREPRGE
jgi:small subunit ribosomal protein S18